MLQKNALAIKCYKCSVAMETSFIKNETIITQPCVKFELGAEQFMVDCTYSTMCVKTISTLLLLNGQKQETITRGCAQQKETTQVFRNRQWQQENSIQEIYQEGCGEFKENTLAASSNTHCYCRTNLCNGSSRLFTLIPIDRILQTTFLMCSLYIINSQLVYNKYL
ncbi:uncharacterized protein LOC119685908 isoform X2 [Teleopsis dalmanni]|uniref:uncharacterized protein LOC119685908 isoform X2 n=1 Tax=Teleopsis dalmanni TaxID=139649 RepID=UPI0018CF932A|nr:uncharacterized protein LOC119685908 isoform X2 [Teleopsis dalmanni]